MAGFAESNRVALYYSEETTWAEVPSSPAMTGLQFTAITGGHKKATVIPVTIRADRMQESLVRVGENSEFGFNFELRTTQYDTLMSAVLAATAFVTATITAIDISASTTDDSFNGVAAGFVTAGFVPGMWVKVTGFTAPANNTYWKIVSVAAGKIVVDGNLTTEVAGNSITIAGKMCRNGVAKRSFCFEQSFTDVTQYQPFVGTRINELNLTLNNRAIITGGFTMIGKSGVASATSVGGTRAAASAQVALDASNNINAILEAGAAISTPLMNASIRINNNLAMQPAIANRFPVGIRYGVLEVTGQLEAYFADLSLWTKFVNHTATSLLIKMIDDNLHAIFITLPRVQFSSGDIPTTGQNTDVFLTLPFQASFDATLNDMIQIDIMP
jgi:hypothetical protein